MRKYIGWFTLGAAVFIGLGAVIYPGGSGGGGGGSGIPTSNGNGTNTTIWTSFTVNGTNANSYFGGTVNATNGFVAIGGTYTGNGFGITNLASAVTDDRSLSIDEEFLTGAASTGSIGVYGWAAQLISSGAFSGNNTTVAGHPGIVRMDTTAVGGSGATLVLADTGTPGHYPIFGMQTVPWRMRLIFETSSTNHQRFFAGVAAGTFNVTNQPANGVFVQFDAIVSSSLQLMCGDGAGFANVALLTPQNNTWYDVLVGSDVAGTVYANINGGSYVTNTTHCPTTALTPFFGTALEDGGSGSVSFFVDAFKLWQSYPQRF